MEIRKADSKGRVTGFEKGRYYYFTEREDGIILLTPSPLHDALAEELEG
jgi:hypothetical protein